jgi:hypothetical protein
MPKQLFIKNCLIPYTVSGYFYCKIFHQENIGIFIKKNGTVGAVDVSKLWLGVHTDSGYYLLSVNLTHTVFTNVHTFTAWKGQPISLNVHFDQAQFQRAPSLTAPSFTVSFTRQIELIIETVLAKN